jgi:hypothetical protein
MGNYEKSEMRAFVFLRLCIIAIYLQFPAADLCVPLSLVMSLASVDVLQVRIGRI